MMRKSQPWWEECSGQKEEQIQRLDGIQELKKARETRLDQGKKQEPAV